ncbi:MAG: hypothetical protein A3G41_04655 [Elusimicrobia bacterium RIFCSPLOWO2_12_FULL_59_9]|nr:MAG: hypothetical protein A3G41_04655 [Elusimicrobia bacterium RIFCSPLOWO2_12_FULL_59_9]
MAAEGRSKREILFAAQFLSQPKWQSVPAVSEPSAPTRQIFISDWLQSELLGIASFMSSEGPIAEQEIRALSSAPETRLRDLGRLLEARSAKIRGEEAKARQLYTQLSETAIEEFRAEALMELENEAR